MLIEMVEIILELYDSDAQDCLKTRNTFVLFRTCLRTKLKTRVRRQVERELGIPKSESLAYVNANLLTQINDYVKQFAEQYHNEYRALPMAPPTPPPASTAVTIEDQPSTAAESQIAPQTMLDYFGRLIWQVGGFFGSPAAMRIGESTQDIDVSSGKGVWTGNWEDFQVNVKEIFEDIPTAITETAGGIGEKFKDFAEGLDIQFPDFPGFGDFFKNFDKYFKYIIIIIVAIAIIFILFYFGGYIKASGKVVQKISEKATKSK